MRVKREGIKSIVFLLFILMSFPVFSATLVSWITVSPNIINENQRYTVVMTVSNLGGGDAPATAPGTLSGTIGTLVSTPSPASIDIPSGSFALFTWVYQAGAGAAGPSCIIASSASGSDTSADVSCCGSNCIQAKPNPALSQDIFISPEQVSIGQAITIRMNVTNSGGSNAEGVVPGSLVKMGTANYSFVSGPTPINVAIIPAANQWFTWIYMATGAGTLCVDSNVTGYAQYSKVTVTSADSMSNCIIVQNSAALACALNAMPSQVSVGQYITLVLTVTNTGQAGAVNVCPSMPGVMGTGGVTMLASPPCTNIPGGTAAYFTWTYSAAAAGNLWFTAGAQGYDENSGITVQTAVCTSNSIIIQTPPVLAAQLIAMPDTVILNQMVTVIMSVTNYGQATAVNVVPVPGNLSKLGTGSAIQVTGPSPASVSIVGGSSGYFTWTFSAVGTGSLCFSGLAQGTDFNSGATVTGNAAMDCIEIIPPSANLVISCTSMASPVSTDQSITVTMLVSNTGSNAANNVVPTLTAMDDTTSLSYILGPTPANAVIAPGGAQQFTWIYNCVGTGTVSFYEEASGVDAVFSTVINAIPVTCGPIIMQAAAGLSCSMDAFPDPATVGGNITVVMTVTNTGQATANNVLPVYSVYGFAAYVQVTAPIPIAAIVGGASGNFTWIYQAASVGSLCFSGFAQGTDANSGMTVSSGGCSDCLVVMPNYPVMTSWINVSPDVICENQRYTVVMSVSNIGAVAAPNTVTGALSGTIGALVTSVQPVSADIPVGGYQEFTWVYQAPAGAAGPSCINGIAISSGMPSTDISCCENNCIQSELPASLFCSISAYPVTVPVGGNITVIMSVTNYGSGNAYLVAVNEIGVQKITITGDATLSMGSIPTLPVSMPGGASAYFTWVYTATEAGTIDFTGRAGGTGCGGANVSTGICQSMEVVISDGTLTLTPTPSTTQIVSPTATPTPTPSTAETASPTATQTPSPTATNTPVGEGIAIITPTQVMCCSMGNVMTITYTNGPTQWSAVTYGTLRIKVPAGWSAPSLTPANAGYYTVIVSGGILIQKMVIGQDMVIRVRDLAANTGAITVVYGAPPGPGAASQCNAGTAEFTVESTPDGDTTYPIALSPQVQVVCLSPTDTSTSSVSDTPTQTMTVSDTATPTPTGTCVGEGSAVIEPACIAPLSSGNILVITYTAGHSTWADWANSGGMVITVPPGWPAPSTNPSDPGYFSVTVTGGVLNSAVVFMGRINVSVSGLQANTGQIIVTYGDKSMGGPGATAPDCGVDPEVFKVETEIDVTMGPLCEIGDSPGVLLCSCPLTPTCTATMTVTQTIQPSATPTITPTETECVGEGNASVNPSGVNPSSTGNTLIFTYTAGPTAWAAAPGYGILRIEIPAGLLALPSTDPSAPGYFTVDVKGGTLTGVAAAGAYIYAYVEGLPANTGIITVTYGDMSGGGPGLTAPPDPCPMGMGIIFPVYSSPGGSSLCRLPALLDPVVFVPCIMPSFTPTSTETLVQDTITVTSTPSKTASPAPSNTNTPTTAMTVTLTVTPAETVTFTLTLTPVFSPTLTITPTQGTGTTLLSIRKTAGGQPPAVGAIITFEIEIRNNDTSPAYNLAVWDTLPSQVELVYDYAGVPKTVDGQYIRWDLSGAPSANPLNPGGIIYIRFDCRITGYSGSVPIANSAGCDYDDASGRHGPIFSEAVFYPVGLPAVYPNPAVDYVKFTNIVPGSQVDIFTLSGEYVNSLDITHLTETWMMNNRFNSRVSPGIYYYLIKDEKGVTRYKGKIFIVRP